MRGHGHRHARRRLEAHHAVTCAAVVHRLLMHMPHHHMTSIETLKGMVGTQVCCAFGVDIVPTLWCMRAGMHQQQRPRQCCQGQGFQKPALRSAQLFVRPLGCAVAQTLIIDGGLYRHGIVIALNNPCTLIRQAHGDVDHLLGIATIAHQIAEQCPTVNALRLGMCHASLKRLQIGMDVRQQRDFHKAIFQ